MRFFTLAAALTSVATAAPSAARSALDVKIESAGNSGQVKATITNTGKDNLQIFRHGTIFDDAHTEKAAIEANATSTFKVPRLRLSTDNLTDSDFQKIDAGWPVSFHLIETHDSPLAANTPSPPRGSRVLGYTQPSRSLQVYCDLYWDDLPAITSGCHRQDQSTTTLHETAHLREIAGTADNCYGYDNIRKLTTAQSLYNADSYDMFASAIYSGC
ncbi:Neutral protease 2 [Beauveria bassiana]|nr:Neutral protease 2 [Beauveria bassiana]